MNVAWSEGAAYDVWSKQLQAKNCAILGLLVADACPAAREVLDAGCGTGNLTVELVRRLPRARYLGVDVSESMLFEAGKKTLGMPVEWVHSDIMKWETDRNFDLVASNAAVHWFSDHLPGSVGRLAGFCRPGGLAAFALAGRTDEALRFDTSVAEAMGLRENPFSRRRATVDDAVAAATANDMTVMDAFIIERRASFSTQAYVTWLVASGNDTGVRAPRDIATALNQRYGDVVEVVHCSVVALFRRDRV